MSQLDTKPHHQRNESTSSNTFHLSSTTPIIISPSIQSDQPPHADAIFPRRRPRGNTFGMPGPDMGKMPTLFASPGNSRLADTPEPRYIVEQRPGNENGSILEDSHDARDPEDTAGESQNEDHTFGIRMPQLSVNRRQRADSYASTMTSSSNTRGRRDDESAQSVDSRPSTSMADRTFMNTHRDRSSLYTTGSAISPLDRSFYERDDQDRSSMLTTSTTLNFVHDWSTNEPRGSIATLTFGDGFGQPSAFAPAFTTRRTSMIDVDAGVAGVGENEDGRSVAEVNTASAQTSVTKGVRSGESPSPTTSLLQSSSHGHSNVTYKNPSLSRHSPLFSRYHLSPRPSVESSRSNYTLPGASKLADEVNSEERTKYSGVQPSNSGARSARMGTIALVNESPAISATMITRSNDTHLYKNGVHSTTAASPLPSSPSLLGRQRQPRPPRPSQSADTALAHVVHRSDSFERLDTRRRSTVSTTGSTSTSFFGGITSIFHSSNNSSHGASSSLARASAGASITPGEVVRQRKSSAIGTGSARLAIGVSQQDRWERERERQKSVVKGKEKEADYSYDNKPSSDTLLHHQQYHQRPKPISIPSDSPSVVSPSGSIFIESFSSPIEDNSAAHVQSVQRDQDDSKAVTISNPVLHSINVQHDPTPIQMASTESMALATRSTSAAENFVNHEPSGRLNPSSFLHRSKERREHYIRGPSQEIGGPYQDVSIHRESDDQVAGNEAGVDANDQDVTFPTTATELSLPLSSAQISSNHLDHGRLLLNRVNDVEDKTNIWRQTHGNDGDLHDAVQSHILSNHNFNLSLNPRSNTTVLSDPTSSDPNEKTLGHRSLAALAVTNNRPPDLSTFAFPSPSFPFSTTTAPTQTPGQTTSTLPTRRLVHSVSQPSLKLSAKSQALSLPPKTKLDKAFLFSAQHTASSPAVNHNRVQTDPHPYAMYSPRSNYHQSEATTDASVLVDTNTNAVLSATATTDQKSAHPYSNAYQRSIQAQDTSDLMYRPTVSQGRHEPHLMATTSGIMLSSNDETIKSQTIPNPHGLGSTLRSSFKLPRTSTPNSTAAQSFSGVVGSNSKTLNATPPKHTSTGGNFRSSIRSSVSMPNLRNLFKLGHSYDNNKSTGRDGVIRSAKAAGKLPSSAIPPLQPTTPKKPKRLKTQYTAETWCDALLFPRPRFRAHVTSPPPSPVHVSALNSATTYPQSQSSPGSLDSAIPVNGTSSPNLAPDTLYQPRTPPRESRFVADSSYLSQVVSPPPPPKLKAPPKGKVRKGLVDPVSLPLNPEADAQPMLSTLEQVLIAGEIRNREREQWSDIATSSFQNRRSRSLSRSRKRAGTITSTVTTSSGAAPSTFEHHGRSRGRTRNHSDADRKSDERTMTHGTTSSISRSLAAGLTTIAVEAFRQPTPTISTVSHRGGHGTGDYHYQTTTVTTDTHSNGYHSRTTSESGPATQRHGGSHTRNTSWGKAALKTLCGSVSADEEVVRHPEEEDGAGTATRGRTTAARINEKRQDNELQSQVISSSTNRPRTTNLYGSKVNFDLPNVPAVGVTLPPSIAVAERSLSPNSNTSETADIVVAVSTPPPQSAVPNDSVIDLSTHPYAHFPASAPYAGPHPSSRDYKPLYTPRHTNLNHRLQPNSETYQTTMFGHSQVSPSLTASTPPHNIDLPQPSSRKEADPTPYAYANVGESNKRESKLGVEEALMSSSFHRFGDAILEDETNSVADVNAPKHSPQTLIDQEEEYYAYAALNETSPSPNVISTKSPHDYGKAQYVQSPPQDPNSTNMSSPSSQSSSYSWMSRPLGAVDDLDQFRDLFFRRPQNSPGTPNNAAITDSNDDFGFYQRSPITSGAHFRGTAGLSSQSPVSPNDREQFSGGRFNLRSPSLTSVSQQIVSSGTIEVDNVVPQDFPEDIESSRASSVIDPDTFVEDTLRLGIVPLSVPVTTESAVQRHSTTLSFVDSNHDPRNRDTVMSTASVYSVPSVNKDNELRQSFVTNDSSTSGVARLLGNFPSPPPPSRIDNSRPDSYHVLGLAESRHILASTSSSLRT